MSIIVFDLETTDLYNCGQILNYCFKEVRDLHSCKIQSCLYGDIALEPHQLPSVDAIMTTKIDLSKDRSGLIDTELEAIKKIYTYLSNIIENSEGQTLIVGHNISKFDLGYLRTSFIRNGFNPYFGRSVSYGDTIHLAKKFAASNPDKNPSNFKLSTLVKEWLNVDVAEFHTSDADVDHTIKLLSFLNDNGIKPTMQTYERTASLVVYLTEFSKGKIVEKPVLKLSENKGYTLWLDLSSDYEKLGRNAVLWFKKDLSSFIPSKTKVSDEDSQKAELAKNFVDSNPQSYYCADTFFEPPPCDIENHIYKMPFQEIGTLHQAIHSNRTNLLQNTSEYCVQLYLRHIMKKPQHKDILQKYVKSRYVDGTFIVSKDEKMESHWTLKSMYDKAKSLLKENSDAKYLENLILLYEDFALKFDINLE